MCINYAKPFVFQSFRIAVNGELAELTQVLPDTLSCLNTDGRLAIISYHSLEDRAAKQTLRSLAHCCVCPPQLPVCGCGREDLVRLVTTKALRPTSDEIARNPRARSARLRVGERL